MRDDAGAADSSFPLFINILNQIIHMKNQLLHLKQQRKVLWWLLSLLLCGNVSRAQEISGKVSGDAGETLPGVNVLIEGTTTGTATAADGTYTIKVPNGSTVLVFSFIGYLTQKVPVGNQQTINVSLVPDLKKLEEVIVVGYGTQKKRDVTGAISSINSESIQQRRAVDVFDAMQGQAAGVQVMTESGRPGAGSTIRIRGTATFEGGANPLYVLDGAPVNDIAGVNPNDIESIEVLKDAASASIYGSRSANGVVIVTTKKGSEARPRLDVRYLQTYSQLSHKIPQANARERRLYEIKRGGTGVQLDSLNPSYNADNDYQDLLTRVAKRNQIDLSISGGSKNLSYYAGLGYLNDEGIVINSYAKIFRGRINVDYKPGSKFSYGNRIQFAYRQENRINEGNTLNQGIQRPPTFRVYLPDGTLAPILGGRRNPVAEALLNKNAYDIYEGNIYNYVGYKFTDYLKLTADVNFQGNYTHNLRFAPKLLSSAAPPVNSGSDQRDFDTYWIAQSYLNFEKTFADKHTVTGLLGVSAERWSDQYTRIAGQNYVTESVLTLNSASIITPGDTRTDETRHSMASVFGRLGYSFKGRYMLNVNFRRDGSSRFASGHRWGSYPSASLGWRFSDETFMTWSKSFLDDAKLRASYGITGNERGGNYDYLSRYNFGSSYYNGVSGVVPNSLFGNKELSWEKTGQLNVGMDLAFFSSRLTLVADYYKKTTDDLLYSSPIPTESGFNQVKVNVGSLENEGFELAIGGYPVRNNNLQWNVGLNVSVNRNTVRKLAGGAPMIVAGKWYVQEGGKLGDFYGWEALGVYPYDESNAYDPNWEQLTPNFDTEGKFTGYTANGQPYTGTVQKLYTNGNVLRGGDVIWNNIRKDSLIDDADRMILGNSQPQFYAGIFSQISYKGFSLSFNFYSNWGNKIYNSARRTLNTYQISNLTPEPYVIYNAWTKPGDLTDVPIPRNNGAGNVREVNSNYIEDGSFIRLRNVRLSYDFGNAIVSKLRLKALGIYVYGNNLVTWTNYKWYDPEITSDNPLQLGEDTGTYPRRQEIGFGINAGF
jgi:TonB-dependent starch-binding outer membrane protein SusC